MIGIKKKIKIRFKGKSKSMIEIKKGGRTAATAR